MKQKGDWRTEIHLIFVYTLCGFVERVLAPSVFPGKRPECLNRDYECKTRSVGFQKARKERKKGVFCLRYLLKIMRNHDFITHLCDCNVQSMNIKGIPYSGNRMRPHVSSLTWMDTFTTLQYSTVQYVTLTQDRMTNDGGMCIGSPSFVNSTWPCAVLCQRR